MKLPIIFTIFVVILLYNNGGGESRRVQQNGGVTLNILDFKAVGDGSVDDSKALADAWEAICRGKEATIGSAKLIIPKNKTFLVKPLKLEGPCKPSSLIFQVDGKIVAPGEPEKTADSCWLCFIYVNNLSIIGMGTFDAKGEAWWGKGDGHRPSALGFHGCKNLEIKETTHINSPRSHIEVENCNNATVSNVNISAPKDSPNTDGIVIAQSKHVYVLKSSIATGDDCIAIKNGSYNIYAIDVKCGPGHGISMGSLGAGGSFDTVENVHVRSCSFTDTLNGARVKTWAGGSGYARNIVFENITLSNSGNPIIIDQHYCNGPHTCPDKGKAVEVSNVTFRGFHGTTATADAITLDCSKTKICSDIHIEQINITMSPSSSSPNKVVGVSCNNARGTTSGLVSPSDVPCFHDHPPSLSSPSPTPYHDGDDDDDEFFSNL